MQEQIIIRADSARGTVLNRQYPVVCLSFFHGFHHILKIRTPRAAHRRSKHLFHRLLRMCSRHAKIIYPAVSTANVRHFFKLRHIIRMRQHSILIFAANRHNLLKQFTHCAFIELSVRHRAQLLQLLFFPLFIKNSFSRLNLIICHIVCHFHPLLKKLYNLAVYLINLLS